MKEEARGQPNCTSLSEIIVQSLHPWNASRQQGTLKMACVLLHDTLIPLPAMVGPYRIIIKHICVSWCFSHCRAVAFEWMHSCTQGATSASKAGTPEPFISTFNHFIVLVCFAVSAVNSFGMVRNSFSKHSRRPEPTRIKRNNNNDQAHKGNGVFTVFLAPQEQDQATRQDHAMICRNLHFIIISYTFFSSAM